MSVAMDFDPNLLRTFVAVHETGGFTRAAQRLHLTQSAVSHQIRRIEEQIGRPLLRRTTRSLALTEDGEDFLRHAREILEASAALTRRFAPSPISGAVRFGVPEIFLEGQLPQLLGQFSRRFPDVRLDVSVGVTLDLHAMIRAGELDLAAVLMLPNDEEGTLLRRTQFVWAAAESFEPQRGASLPFSFSPPPCLSRHVGVSALEAAGIGWHVVFTSHSQHDQRAAILAGFAIAPVTRENLRPGMKIVDGLYGLPPLPAAELRLVWSEGGKTPAAQEFGRLLLDLAEPPPAGLARKKVP